MRVNAQMAMDCRPRNTIVDLGSAFCDFGEDLD
jgi:hypothetical protein